MGYTEPPSRWAASSSSAATHGPGGGKSVRCHGKSDHRQYGEELGEFVVLSLQAVDEVGRQDSSAGQLLQVREVLT